METIKLFIKSALIDNVVFIQYLAICPFIGMTNDTEKATGMGLATSFVLLITFSETTQPLGYSRNLLYFFKCSISFCAKDKVTAFTLK